MIILFVLYTWRGISGNIKMKNGGGGKMGVKDNCRPRHRKPAAAETAAARNG